MHTKFGRARVRNTSFALVAAIAVLAAAWGDDASTSTSTTAGGVTATTGATSSGRTLKISAIPDQDPEKLVARDGAMAAYLTSKLGVKVEYVPVTDYAASSVSSRPATSTWSFTVG
jgi:phosphonate transport system substrate-binding protein